MLTVRTLLVLPILSSAYPNKGCDDRGIWHSDGERWIRNDHFHVVCKQGVIQVTECVTDRGTVLPVGTESFVEDGVEYMCVDETVEEGSGQNPDDRLCEDSNDLTINNFLICCLSRRLKGCVDGRGDWVKQGHFITHNNALKLCNIQPGGLRGRIENRGCFNGTLDDDVEDTQYHVAKYAVWRVGDIDLRCGDDGIQPYRCYVREKKGERQMYVGSAWIDDQGDFNVCK